MDGYLRPVQFLDHLTVIKKQAKKQSELKRGKRQTTPHETNILTDTFCANRSQIIVALYLSVIHLIQAGVISLYFRIRS